MYRVTPEEESSKLPSIARGPEIRDVVSDGLSSFLRTLVEIKSLPSVSAEPKRVALIVRLVARSLFSLQALQGLVGLGPDPG